MRKLTRLGAGRALCIAALLAALGCSAIAHAQYKGEVTAKWLGDGRRMQLVAPFSYVDKRGKRWDVPAGAVVDGASIPRILWPLIGSPYAGQYRRASVIHDYYCDTMSRPWKDVHRVFYDGLLTDGNGPEMSMIMYTAVYRWGPRWEYVKGKPTRTRHLVREPSKADMQELQQWVKQRKPTLKEVERRFGPR